MLKVQLFSHSILYEKGVNDTRTFYSFSVKIIMQLCHVDDELYLEHIYQK